MIIMTLWLEMAPVARPRARRVPTARRTRLVGAASWARSCPDRGLARMNAMAPPASGQGPPRRGDVAVGTGAGGGLGELGLELRSLLGDSRASAARTAGPDRSILAVTVVISQVSRPAAAPRPSARRPAMLVDRRPQGNETVRIATHCGRQEHRLRKLDSAPWPRLIVSRV
jgi:hypothetical protein